MATITHIKRVENSSVNAPPVWCAAGREKVACYSGRPAGGGPVAIVYFIAGDGREVIPSVDVRDHIPDFEDSVLATPFVSDFDGTIKAFCSYKRIGGGNDREIAVISTGFVPDVTR